MKRILTALLTLALLCTLPLPLIGCGKAPSGFVGDGSVVFDNDTPFVYDADYKTHVKNPRLEGHPLYNFTGAPMDTPGLAADSVSAFFLHFDDDGMTDERLAWLKDRYLDFTADFGTKVIRTSADRDGNPVLYTVYCETDNQLSYVFLKQDTDGGLYVREVGFADVTTDERALRREGVLDKDMPAALLGDALPSRLRPENADPAKLAKRTERACLAYADLCDSLGLAPEAAARQADSTVKASYRCLVYGSFGVFARYSSVSDSDPELDLSELTGSHEDAVVCYDLAVHEDGTGVLTSCIYQWSRREYPQYTPVEGTARMAIVTADEVTAFENLLKQNDFAGIPTWNPAEAPGLDGSTTYFSDGDHLIAHWEPSPYFGIFHFRAFLERLDAVYGK